MTPVVVTAAVEGVIDQAVLARMLKHERISLNVVHGLNGKDGIRMKLKGFNNAARFSPWIVLLDLDKDADCAPTLRSELLPTPAEKMVLRIAVRAVESWLMADSDAFSKFLGLRADQIPSMPDNLDDPKQTLVELARTSSKRSIRNGMPPRPDSGKKVGPEYATFLIEFASARRAGWNPRRAAKKSESLRKAIKAIAGLRRR